MSNFLQDPGFQPDENFKSFIDSLFADKKPVSENKPASLEVVIPDAPVLGEAETKLALKMASDELEAIKQAFLEFQDKISGMATYTFLYPGISKFGEECAEFVDLVEDNFQKDKLTEIGEEEYAKAMKLRAHILATVFNSYKQER